MALHDISSKPRIILDTCILIDIMVASRTRHSVACRLNKELKSRGIIIVMPMHAHFELLSATKHEVRKNTKTEMFKSEEREDDQLEYFGVSINDEFVKKYSCTDLPKMSACDEIGRAHV